MCYILFISEVRDIFGSRKRKVKACAACRKRGVLSSGFPLDRTSDAWFLNGWKYPAFEKRIQGRAHFASGHGYSIAGRTVIESSMIEEAAMGIVEEEVGGALGVVRRRDRLGFVV